MINEREEFLKAWREITGSDRDEDELSGFAKMFWKAGLRAALAAPVQQELVGYWVRTPDTLFFSPGMPSSMDGIISITKVTSPLPPPPQPDHAERAAPVQQEPVSLPVAILPDELAAFMRFCETVEDDSSYDVAKPMMQRLAEIGLVRRLTRNIYEQTYFGLSVLNGDFNTSPRHDPTELEMHRADYKACKDAGFDGPGELLSAYKTLLTKADHAEALADALNTLLNCAEGGVVPPTEIARDAEYTLSAYRASKKGGA